MSLDNNPRKNESQLLRQALSFHNTGQTSAAHDIYDRILRLNPSHVEALHLSGVLLCAKRKFLTGIERLQKAIELSPQKALYHTNLAAAYFQKGDLLKTLQAYKDALKIEPENLEIICKYAQVLLELGRYQQAEKVYEEALLLRSLSPLIFTEYAKFYAKGSPEISSIDKAISIAKQGIELFPENPDLLNDVSAYLLSKGNVAEAHQFCESALKTVSNFPPLYFTMGNIKIAAQDYEAAAVALQKAVSLDPRFTLAFSQLSQVLSALGRHKEALAASDRAILLNPYLPTSYGNLAKIHLENLSYEEALKAAYRMKELSAENDPVALNILVLCFSSIPQDLVIKFSQHTWFFEGIMSCIEKEDLNIHPLIPNALGAFKKKYQILRMITQDAQELEQEQILEIVNDPFLLTLMNRVTLRDHEIEIFLTKVRATLLQNRSHWNLARFRHFLTALADQCYTNDFIYSVTPSEARDAIRLKTEIESNFGTTNRLLKILLFCCYYPLSYLKKQMEFQHRHIRPFVENQIENKETEQNLEKGLASLSSIPRQGVSGQTRRQYEEFPCPRWKFLPYMHPQSVEQFFRQRFPWCVFPPTTWPKKPAIWVPGCGTGKRALMLAQIFATGQITAFDLSRNALAYGARKAQEFNLKNITFAQADLTQFTSAPATTFDLIEAVGILNHLENPQTGWKILLNHLKPGGFMRVGIHSKQARAFLDPLRQTFTSPSMLVTSQDIRDLRQRIFTLPPEDPLKKVTDLEGFYTAPECRELLMGTQENCFTLSDIEQLINDTTAPIDFLGFEMHNISMFQAYKAKNPDDPQGLDLKSWACFEENHPDTFRDMYQFWIYKRP